MADESQVAVFQVAYLCARRGEGITVMGWPDEGQMLVMAMMVMDCEGGNKPCEEECELGRFVREGGFLERYREVFGG